MSVARWDAIAQAVALFCEGPDEPPSASDEDDAIPCWRCERPFDPTASRRAVCCACGWPHRTEDGDNA